MFDLADYWEPSVTDQSQTLIERMRMAGRAEAQAAAARLDAIGELFELRRVERGECADWAVDTWAAVGGEVAAAFATSLAMAGSYLRYALAMRQRLPEVAAAFRAGTIDYRTFQTLAYRTDLITDEQVLTRVDAELALRVPRWPSMTRGKLAHAIDRIVAAADPDARRRVREQLQDRHVTIWESEDGMAEMTGRLCVIDATTLDARLRALVATVCAADPRTNDQRRADALGALAAGAQRLGCGCGTPDCTAAQKTASPVVIHVVAEQATVEGRSQTPAALLGAEGLIPADLVTELAIAARVQPIVAPAHAEPRYRPSATVAALVRARDLTCRAPGCDRPATDCDLDHTIAFADGGTTHPSNLKCLCRTHHLLATFWGWRAQQLPDGTVIWRLADHQTYVTTPGSALLFPALATPTGDPPEPDPARADRRGQPTAKMPLRARTRAQHRAHYIAAERHRNHQARRATPAGQARATDTRHRPPDPDDPPPF
ncbi:HNH endonuclease signature motif containing protein [Mycobacterium spongiae]|nr:HNH endonuclease signature motif containing protein [Mycobacterium spongiae]